MKIALEWDNEAEFDKCSNIADMITTKIKVRAYLGHILITNEVE